MSDDLQLPTLNPEPTSGFIVPAIVADTHRDAGERFIEYFAATIRNANTRAADIVKRRPIGALTQFW
jgi:hypothetical protein